MRLTLGEKGPEVDRLLTGKSWVKLEMQKTLRKELREYVFVSMVVPTDSLGYTCQDRLKNSVTVHYK